MIKVIAFDCFGTVFDMSGVPGGDIVNYVNHVRHADFTPYVFPESWWKLQAHPDSAEGIKKLQRAGFKCIALSNGSHNLIWRISATNGINWDHTVDLVAHRVYKPHVDAYRCIQTDLGIPPEETLMVTANPTFGDIEGSAAIGMKSQVIRHGYPNNILELAEMLENDSCP